VPDIPDIVSLPSPFSIDATLERLEATIASHELTLFAHIDHGAGAAAVGMQMRPAHVLIFGSARAGTPLMIASPLLALDLPLRVLVWEDADQKVWISYRTPDALVRNHAIPGILVKNISGIEGLLKAALSSPAPRRDP